MTNGYIIDETYKKFEMDIDAVALKVKNIEDLKNVQKLLPVTGPNSLIHIKTEWHDLKLKTDISMKEINKQNNKDYEFCFNCSCKKKVLIYLMGV